MIDYTTREGKLLRIACAVLRAKGPPRFKCKGNEEIITGLDNIAKALSKRKGEIPC